MGFSKATGKGRLDKYYHLAKDQGYRARSAFKLIQLNKKYNFLGSSRCVVDLCAAPGGWLQVAKKYMPVSSLLIGVDLTAIKPIPGVITFQSDITSEKCRAQLRAELKTWKADVVLHDGAPNVGTAWAQDAFSQAELTLMSLKLAVEFLGQGGIFVTKVFRSKDYNNLMWVFKQLFRKVEATKPPSSRNVSAEIFVVCRDFIAPRRIDPRFLDPAYVFQELETEAAGPTVNILRPEKHIRARDGYEEGNYTMFKTMDALDYLRSTNPTDILARYSALTFDTESSRALLEMPVTNSEIPELCKDLKVLGRGDFRSLMKWHAAMSRKHSDLVGHGVAGQKRAREEGEESEEEEEEEDLDQLAKSALNRQKRERRRANEKKQRTIMRLQLDMATPVDLADTSGDKSRSLFDLKGAEKRVDIRKLRKADIESIDVDELEMSSDGEYLYDPTTNDGIEVDEDYGPDSEDELGNLEEELDHMYDEYTRMKRDRDARLRVEQARLQEEEFTGFGDRPVDSDGDADSDENYDRNAPYPGGRPSHGDSSDSDDSDDDDDEAHGDAVSDDETEMPIARARTQKRKGPLTVHLDEEESAEAKAAIQAGRLPGKAALWFNQPMFQGLDDEAEASEDAMDEDEIEEVAVSSADEDDQDQVKIEMVPRQPEAPARDPSLILDTPEAMTLAYALANGQMTKNDLLNQGFHRWAFNDTEGLPDWFVHDERRHRKPNLPVTKEAVRILREKQRAIDARPIKKVAEAKSRKKFKASQRLAKVQSKANHVADNDDLTEREKSKAINQLLKKSTNPQGKEQKKVSLVVARGKNRGVQGRPQGVKGRYKMVDARMKKEMRATKRKAKKAQKGRKKN
ncbi:AdoMet-dependent rRNA methyltransferase spb1 [Tieghemiomyces parasiticus]|uniref:AdoMet-dependent rRNA methyltransferase spb1 n=1 Tax=Tieghemiomyces parasiticus TaxID=78921 RepID=A0A9W8ABG0_9FUNG|nr:AdoMet-dependent rRNA methyltransferase spb1 [Tieghemiomyces parasiticus]